MNCPNCGTPNPNTARFCATCGNALPVAQVAVPVPIPAPAANPITTPATIGGLVGLAGGVAVIIGWLMPWFGIGSGYGGLEPGLSSFSIGAASGFQISIATLIGGLGSIGLGAASGSNGGAALGGVMGLLLLALFALFMAMPFMGLLNILGGNTVYGLRSSTDDQSRIKVTNTIQKMRSRSLTGLILLVVIFALVSLVPFLTNALGGGFFLTAIAFGTTFIGIFLTKPSQP